jgi:hypothetical protein
MRGHQTRPIEDVEAVLGLSYFQGAGNEGVGSGVTVTVDADVALGVDDAVVELIDLGDVKGKRFELRQFPSEELSGRGSEVSSKLRVPAVTELSSLLVELGEVLETPAGQKVVLDGVHGALDESRTVDMAQLVGLETKPETLGEGLHLRNGGHVFACPAQDDHVRVVDEAALADPRKVLEGLGEKQLTVKPIEGGIVLEEQHAGIAQDRRGGLNRSEFAADDGPVRGGIVLELLAGLEVVVPRGSLGAFSDAVLSTESGEGGIGQLATELHEFLVDPDEVSSTLGVERADLVQERLGFFRTLDTRGLVGAAFDDLAYRGAGDLNGARDLPVRVALVVES